ncbi:hypothetical protein KIPB_009337, partial [Kipferlia bialata]|eukprot:g9337.t1
MPLRARQTHTLQQELHTLSGTRQTYREVLAMALEHNS